MTLTVTLDVTNEDAQDFLTWFNDYNSTIKVPFEDHVAFFRWLIQEQIDSGVRKVRTYESIRDRWESLTADQKSRIRAIANE
jgi:hypothetical protein